jgi:hypothetical protein
MAQDLGHRRGLFVFLAEGATDYGIEKDAKGADTHWG